MHIVIGGAYNGKRKYVYDRVEKPYTEFEGIIPDTYFTKDETVIISGFEQLVMAYRTYDELQVAEIIVTKLKKLVSETNVICICNDLGRGVVPIDKEERFLRDACGRVYQKLFQEAQSVTRIWYGLAERLK
ncbi:bifunctional adenosylcobinamide kinase/adenosylcobinamide-phosphate guanylyltransferase [Lysinibacillus sp. LZ02]|uniref:bifunctional adenosylcobinamide kinase/adenosylcobinamide-phosphate guanylyltransferase n=1 Tax=Lysinibacillus sp. LZ02 TaxID=3420668 RepID=UPI003D363C38